jgi:hypothetical protein
VRARLPLRRVVPNARTFEARARAAPREVCHVELESASMSDANELPAAAGERGAAGVSDGPLSERDFALLAAAGRRSRALRRAARLATTNGVSLIVCAMLCLFGAAFEAWLLGAAVVLGASAAVELRGADMLRKLDARAPRWLALNQGALWIAIAIYCAAQVVSGLRSGSGVDEIARAYPQLAEPMRDALKANGMSLDALDTAYRGAVVFFYAAVLGVSALYQGSCAYYYWTRAPILEAQRAETPAWVLEAERRLRA